MDSILKLREYVANNISMKINEDIREIINSLISNAITMSAHYVFNGTRGGVIQSLHNLEQYSFGSLFVNGEYIIDIIVLEKKIVTFPTLYNPENLRYNEIYNSRKFDIVIEE